MTVVRVRFQPGLKPIIEKHQQHDQQSHGNWASESSLSNLDSMPYQWRPKKEVSGYENIKIKPNILEQGHIKAQEVARNVADAEISIRVDSEQFNSIVEDGFFRGLKEQQQINIEGESYFSVRKQLESEQWKVPSNAKGIIYGYLNTDYDGHIPAVSQYGNIKVNLKENVRGRTTFTMGDSLNEKLSPILLTEAQKPNLSKDKTYQIFAFQYKSSIYIDDGKNLYEQNFKPFAPQYYEAQIHGGVTLNDISSIDIKGPSESWYKTGQGFLSDKTKKTLRDKGIKINE